MREMQAHGHAKEGGSSSSPATYIIGMVYAESANLHVRSSRGAEAGALVSEVPRQARGARLAVHKRARPGCILATMQVCADVEFLIGASGYHKSKSRQTNPQ